MNAIINIHPPDSVKYQGNVTINFEVERNPIKIEDLHSSVGEQTTFHQFIKNDEGKSTDVYTVFPEQLTKGAIKYPMNSEKFAYQFESDITEDVTNLPMEMMPGFNFSWKYEPKVESQPIFNTEYHPYNFGFIK